MHRHLAVVTVSCALALVGCSASDSNPAPADAASPASAPAETTQTDAADPGATADETGAETTADSGDAASGERVLDISERHPNGAVLDITGITVEDRTVTLAAELFNGGTNDMHIAIEGGTAVRLKDDSGNVYPFVKPADAQDGQLTMAPGESIGGSWTFLGGAGGAGELTMTINKWDDDNAPNQWDGTATPEFRVTIPLR